MKSKHKATKRMTPAEQSARFIEAAKKAEADERPESFDKVFDRIITRIRPVRKKE